VRRSNREDIKRLLDIIRKERKGGKTAEGA